MYMLMIVAKIYAGLLNDEQTDVNNAKERYEKVKAMMSR